VHRSGEKEVKAQKQGGRRGPEVAKLKLMPCQRCSSPRLGISPTLPAENKLLLKGIACRAERWKAEGGGCEDQCIKHPCKLQLQGLKNAAQLEKTLFQLLILLYIR